MWHWLSDPFGLRNPTAWFAGAGVWVYLRNEFNIREQGVQFTREPWVPENGPFAKTSTLMSPDGVRVEVVEPFRP